MGIRKEEREGWREEGRVGGGGGGGRGGGGEERIEQETVK